MKAVRVITSIIGLLVMVVVLWKEFGTKSGNKLVEASNEARTEAVTLLNSGLDTYKELVKTETVKGLPGNRAELKPKVDQTSANFEKSATQFRAAASKLEEASSNLVDSKVSDYWKLRAEAENKNAARADALRKIVLLLADESVVDVETFNSKSTPLVAEANKHYEESEAAVKKAAEIEPKK